MPNPKKIIRPLWIEVDLAALSSNFKAIKAYLEPKTKIIATIKQSAYGHGLVPVAKQLKKDGVDIFGVGSIEEALALREAGFDSPVIVLTAVLSNFCNLFLEHKVIPTIVDLEFAKKLNRLAKKMGRKVAVHVKVDTGMGRLGFHYKQADQFVRELAKLKNIILEGIYTHFPAADSDPGFTQYQIDAFNGFIEQLKTEGISFKYQHCANSIGLLRYSHTYFNMVRPGLILYGVKPQAEVDIGIKPVLSLKSRIVFIKQVKKGSGVSYGRTYIAKNNRNIATVAVGYADGYPWSLSNKSKVLIKGKFFELVGRVCMDHIMIDLKGRSDIKVGEEVILIGESKTKKILAEDLAELAQTIPYEIVSRLSERIPRIYKK
ncbi:MAG: alanine racemase [Candidatus Omnitrophica bacterium]|nr:alanine racemase [Candidatus Omnitrophota bacterium]